MLDILLIGDSFTWGTGDESIADHLRDALPDQTVYSAGIHGNGITQWRFHFEDVVNRLGKVPEIVVFNFYAGNDISDTNLFQRAAAFGEANPAVVYFTFYNAPYQLPKKEDGLMIPKLPEMFYIALGLLSGFEQVTADPTRLGTDYEVMEAWPISHEPQNWEFTDAIYEEISATADLVQELAPQTEIVLSYVPTISGIYGPLLLDCEQCDTDIVQQAKNSELLANWSEQLGINYIDVTPTLQLLAIEGPMWAPDGHFSDLGYEAYALALARALEDLPIHE